jgi:tetratricopeptide (TPR) repeat protein
MTVLAAFVFLANASTHLSAQASSAKLAEHQRAAQQAEARGDFETAIREYSVLTKSLPGSAELQSNLGVALYFHNDLELAEVAFRHAISANPDLYTPHLFLGLVKSRESQPDAAAAELEKAVKINNADPTAHTWLAYAYIAQSRYQQAVEQLQLASSEQPGDVDVAYALGQCFLELGKRASAALLKAAPDGGRTWQLAAEQAEAQGNPSKALDFYLQALRRRPDIQSVRARIIALNGRPPEQGSRSIVVTGDEDALYDQVREYEQRAKAAFEKISVIDPDSYRVHQVLGDAYVAADRFDDAILEYKSVLQRKPDLPGVHGALCNVLARTAQLEKAITECEAEIALSPYSAEAYVHAARVHLLSENYERAEVLLQKALKLDNPPIALYKYLGKVSLNQKKYQAAVSDLKRYLAVETKDSSAFYLLSRAYKGLGDTQRMNEAIASYKRTSTAYASTNQAQQALDSSHQDQALIEDELKDPPKR